MKINKKKTFGLNVFDVFIGLIIVSVVVGIVKFYKREDQWRVIKIQLTDQYQQWWQGTPFWIIENIKVGNIEKGAGGELIAKVEELESYERGDGTRDVYLIVKIKGFYNANKGKFIYKNRPVEVGGAIELHLNKVLALGLVISDDYKKEEIDKDWLEVRFKWLDVFPWQAEMLEPGLQMRFSDSEEESAEILSVSSRLAEVAIETSYGYIVVAQNPLKRDVVLRLKLLAEKRGDNYYFAGHQKLKVGEPLWVYFPEVDIDKTSSNEFNKLSVMEIKPFLE